jgi:aspartate carbamoyltransferase regulatory subunit
MLHSNAQMKTRNAYQKLPGIILIKLKPVSEPVTVVDMQLTVICKRASLEAMDTVSSAVILSVANALATRLEHVQLVTQAATQMDLQTLALAIHTMIELLQQRNCAQRFHARLDVKTVQKQIRCPNVKCVPEVITAFQLKVVLMSIAFNIALMNLIQLLVQFLHLET